MAAFVDLAKRVQQIGGQLGLGIEPLRPPEVLRSEGQMKGKVEPAKLVILVRANGKTHVRRLVPADSSLEKESALILEDLKRVKSLK